MLRQVKEEQQILTCTSDSLNRLFCTGPMFLESQLNLFKVGLGLGCNSCFFFVSPSSWPLKQDLILVLKFVMFGLFD
jgi:hypothetical protein